MIDWFWISDFSHIEENISNLRTGDNLDTVEFQGKLRMWSIGHMMP